MNCGRKVVLVIQVAGSQLLSSWISTNSPKATVEEQANKDDVLVPIRLELDIDGLVLRDTFTWNLHGKERERADNDSRICTATRCHSACLPTGSISCWHIL